MALWYLLELSRVWINGRPKPGRGPELEKQVQTPWGLSSMHRWQWSHFHNALKLHCANSCRYCCEPLPICGHIPMSEWCYGGGNCHGGVGHTATKTNLRKLWCNFLLKVVSNPSLHPLLEVRCVSIAYSLCTNLNLSDVSHKASLNFPLRITISNLHPFPSLF